MVCLLVSIILIVMGLIFKIFPPKKINSIYGYRTVTSMKNKNSWDIAQRIGAISIILTGIINGLVGLILIILNMSNDIFELTFFLLTVVIMLIIDEIKLRKGLNNKKNS
jgi:uncharacterized membrane protein